MLEDLSYISPEGCSQGTNKEELGVYGEGTLEAALEKPRWHPGVEEN